MYSYILSIRGQIGCLGVLLFIAWTYFSVKRRRTTSHKIFSALLIVSLVNILFDMITVYTINHVHEVPLGLNHFLHIIYMSTMAASMYFFYMYILNLAYETFRFKPYQLIPLAVAVVASCTLGFDYVESPYGNYSWGAYATVAFVSAYVYLILSVILLIRRWKLLDLKSRRAIAASMAFLLSIAVLQGTFPELLITSIGLTLINLALFYTVESPDALMIELLAAEREKADNANRAKSQFLAQMSHEIRTPINAVLGMNEMIRHESKDAQIIEYADNIHSAGETLLSIINTILDFSKIEGGKMEIIPVNYDTASVINNLVNSIQERAKARNLELILDIDPNLPCRLFGDDIRISQIIMNLLTNAVKYTEKGSVTFTVRDGGRLADDMDLFVSVKDTGIGIREEDMDKLFKSFERIEEERNRNIEGTGLGMAIVTGLLSMMGSKLDVKSVYGEGSEFSFVLHQRIMDSTPIGNYEERLRESAAHEKKGTRLRVTDARILVVDDNEMNLKVAANLMKLNGIVPDLAFSGAEAIEMISKKAYDIVFLDHMMPKMDGIETLKELKNRNILPKGTKVIALTANAIVGAKETYLAAGFTDYLSKPIELPKMDALFVKYLPKEMVEYVSEENEAAAVEASKGEGGTDASKSAAGGTVPAKSSDDGYGGLRAAGIDPATGLRYCQNDDGFYRSILKDYAKSADEKARSLADCFGAEDWANYAIYVHALKSTSKTIGAADLSAAAQKLEAAAKEGDGETIRAEHGSLMSAYAAVADAIRASLPDAVPAESGSAGTEGAPAESGSDDVLEFAPEGDDVLEFPAE